MFQATVAHLAEQHIRNVQVAGSIPASGSTEYIRSPDCDLHGGLAQLGARMTGSHEVTGSSPVFSTILNAGSSALPVFCIFWLRSAQSTQIHICIRQ